MTVVSAVIRDPANNPYTNALVVASFVGQSTTPGAGPYVTGGVPQGQFQTVVPGETDSFGAFSMPLAGNDTITPTPSQWKFTVVSSTSPQTSFSVLITITGATQDVSAAMQAAAAPLNPSVGFGNITVTGITDTGSLNVSGTATLGTTNTGAVVSSSTVSAQTGFRFNNTAPANQALVGNGTNIVPTALALASAQFANQGTATTVLHGNAAGNPAFAAVSLTQDVSGTLPVVSGGTGTTTSTGGGSVVLSGSPTLTGTVTLPIVNGATLTGAGSGNNVNLLNDQAAAAAITGNSAFQNIYTFTIPANTMQAGKGIRVKVLWTHSSGVASVSYQLVFGGTVIIGPFSSSVNGAGNVFSISAVEIFNNAGVQNAQHGSYDFILAGTTIPFSGGNLAAAANTANATAISMQFNVANTDQITPLHWRIELIQ